MRKHYPLDPTTGAENAALLPWSDGVPATGTQGSYPGQLLFTDMEAELLSAIDAAGLPRTGGDLTQLAQAMSIGLYLGVFTGTANALTAALPGSVPIPKLIAGMRFHGIVGLNANTGAATLGLSGFLSDAGVKPIVRKDGASVLGKNDLAQGALVTLEWDGAAFRFVGAAQSDLVALIQSLTRINLTQNITVYVRPDGNDSNSGLANTAADAFGTLQGAYNRLVQLYNFAGYSATIQLGAPGTYAGLIATNVGVTGIIVVSGNTAAQGSYIITPVSNADGTANCLASGIQTLFGTGVTLDMSGVSVGVAGAAAKGLAGGKVTIGNVTVKCPVNNPSVDILNAYPTGIVSRNGPVTVAGPGIIGSVFNIQGGQDLGSEAVSSSAFTINNVTFTQFYRVNAGRASTQTTAFAGSGNVGSQYLIGGSGFLDSAGGAALNTIPGNAVGTEVDGGHAAGGTAWTAYTPSLSAVSGALGSTTATGRYKRDGKTVTVSIAISISSVGTAAGGLYIGLPMSNTSALVLAGADGAGKTLAGRQQNSSDPRVLAFYADASSVIVAGNLLFLSGTFETNAA